MSVRNFCLTHEHWYRCSLRGTSLHFEDQLEALVLLPVSKEEQIATMRVA